MTTNNLAAHYEFLWKSAIADATDDEQQIRELVRPFLSDWELNGDKYGAHGPVDHVGFLIKKLKTREHNNDHE